MQTEQTLLTTTSTLEGLAYLNQHNGGSEQSPSIGLIKKGSMYVNPHRAELEKLDNLERVTRDHYLWDTVEQIAADSIDEVDAAADDGDEHAGIYAEIERDDVVRVVVFIDGAAEEIYSRD